tara:strand:+ start:1921 stop:2193 length:273 start_codon:yes stop_codon:yes gene_type:complete
MPFYVYRCDECEKEFTIFHSIGERCFLCIQATDECEVGSTLTRRPSNFSKKTEDVNKEHKAGELVKEFIETNREDLKKEKKQLSKQEYKE